MNNILDLHEEFINILKSRISRKNIASTIADILLIERDAAYRRLSGKVNFSVREIGIIAGRLNISIDKLLHKDEDYLWLPFMLKKPMKMESMDNLFDIIDMILASMVKLKGEPRESGNVCNILPISFYIYSPVLTKFMMFKWGYNFVGTNVFNNYSKWELPASADNLLNRLKTVAHFDRSYYICDESIMLTLSHEINNLLKLNVITVEEKNEIRYALKDMLLKLEQTLEGRFTPTILNPNVEFYLSPLDIGFTSTYFMAGDTHVMTMLTNFSFSFLDYDQENFRKLKEWLDSFKNISTLLSRSGRIERRLYFEKQHKIVDFRLR